MLEYPKIQTVFLRDPENKYKTLLEGQWAKPEFEYLKDNRWVFTEKVDGTNIRVMLDDKRLRFAGKTDRAHMHPTLLEALEQIFVPKREYMQELLGISSVCLYGEGYGPKIQKGGGLYRDTPSFVLFDIKIGDLWLRRRDVEEVASLVSIDAVPIIWEGSLEEMVNLARDGFNSQWGNFKAEGIVARPATELLNRRGKRIITKIKYKDFARDR